MSNKYYSMKEVAVALGLSRAQVYYLKNTGKIHAKRIGAQWVATSIELKRLKKSRDGERNAE